MAEEQRYYLLILVSYSLLAASSAHFDTPALELIIIPYKENIAPLTLLLLSSSVGHYVNEAEYIKGRGRSTPQALLSLQTPGLKFLHVGFGCHGSFM